MSIYNRLLGSINRIKGQLAEETFQTSPSPPDIDNIDIRIDGLEGEVLRETNKRRRAKRNLRQADSAEEDGIHYYEETSQSSPRQKASRQGERCSKGGSKLSSGVKRKDMQVFDGLMSRLDKLRETLDEELSDRDRMYKEAQRESVFSFDDVSKLKRHSFGEETNAKINRISNFRMSNSPSDQKFKFYLGEEVKSSERRRSNDFFGGGLVQVSNRSSEPTARMPHHLEPDAIEAQNPATTPIELIPFEPCSYQPSSSGQTTGRLLSHRLTSQDDLEYSQSKKDNYLSPLGEFLTNETTAGGISSSRMRRGRKGFEGFGMGVGEIDEIEEIEELKNPDSSFQFSKQEFIEACNRIKQRQSSRRLIAHQERRSSPKPFNRNQRLETAEFTPPTKPRRNSTISPSNGKAVCSIPSIAKRPTRPQQQFQNKDLDKENQNPNQLSNAQKQAQYDYYYHNNPKKDKSNQKPFEQPPMTSVYYQQQDDPYIANLLMTCCARQASEVLNLQRREKEFTRIKHILDKKENISSSGMKSNKRSSSLTRLHRQRDDLKLKQLTQKFDQIDKRLQDCDLSNRKRSGRRTNSQSPVPSSHKHRNPGVVPITPPKIVLPGSNPLPQSQEVSHRVSNSASKSLSLYNRSPNITSRMNSKRSLKQEHYFQSQQSSNPSVTWNEGDNNNDSLASERDYDKFESVKQPVSFEIPLDDKKSDNRKTLKQAYDNAFKHKKSYRYHQDQYLQSPYYSGQQTAQEREMAELWQNIQKYKGQELSSLKRYQARRAQKALSRQMDSCHQSSQQYLTGASYNSPVDRSLYHSRNYLTGGENHSLKPPQHLNHQNQGHNSQMTFSPYEEFPQPPAGRHISSGGRTKSRSRPQRKCSTGVSSFAVRNKKEKIDRRKLIKQYDYQRRHMR